MFRGVEPHSPAVCFPGCHAGCVPWYAASAVTSAGGVALWSVVIRRIVSCSRLPMTGGRWDERASGWSAAPAARARVRAGRLGESTVSVPNAMMRHAPL